MTDVLHRDLPDAELHEPKGITSAGQGSVYKSNGGGSGTWSKVEASMLQGIYSNGTAGQTVVFDGNGGFTAQAANSYLYGCSLTTPQGAESSQIIVPLRPTNNWTQTASNNVTVVDNRIVFTHAGLYHATFTVSAYTSGVTTEDIRSLLVVDDASAVIASLANDSKSSTTVSAIFRVSSGNSIRFHKTAAANIPGVLLQYAIYRLGA